MKRSPEMWREVYSNGMYTMPELFSQLVECSKSYPIPNILAVLGEVERQKFNEFIRRCAVLEKEEDIGTIGNDSTTWGLADIRRFVPYIMDGSVRMK